MPSFSGPVFIVGMPRSGTKLLRELLNSHSSIFIPPYETELYPFIVSIWEQYGDLSNYDNFLQFYNNVSKLPYFIYCKKEGKRIDAETWYQFCRNNFIDFIPPNIFEALVRHDTGTLTRTTCIWGDKSPTYLKHISLLKSHYPKARFIHIVRDVRDYCLSVNKAWGKNMFRACQRWVDDVSEARSAGANFSSDYLELRYEDLLSDPEFELRLICSFLGISFEDSMLNLTESPEQVGDTKGKKEIVKSNQKKYLKQMSTKTINKLELISGDLLRSLGYTTDYQGEVLRLSDLQLITYQGLDGVNLGLRTLRRRGLRETVKHMVGAYRATNNL